MQALRERWWILAVAAVVAALAAYAYAKLPFVEPRWRSSVLLQATGRLDYGNFLAVEKELRPLAEQVRQLSVMRDVDRNLHTDLPPERMLERTRAAQALQQRHRGARPGVTGPPPGPHPDRAADAGGR